MKTLISTLALVGLTIGCDSTAKTSVEGADAVASTPASASVSTPVVEDAAAEVAAEVAPTASVSATPVDSGSVVVDAAKKDPSSKK